MTQSTCQKIDAVFSLFKCPLPIDWLAMLAGKKKQRRATKKTVRKMIDAGLLVEDELGWISRPKNYI
jgi:hypothetical protein